MDEAAARWAAGLESLAIPQPILDAAPVWPWGFEPSIFERASQEALDRDADTPSDAAARAALPDRGRVLDVGCGAGAAGLRLAVAGPPRAGLVVGVDPGADLLAAFAERAERVGVAHREVQGAWPDSAAAVEPADVVTCHHVTYNVPHIVGFLEALGQAARHRVVVEMTAEHPLTWLGPYWLALHGWDRPDGPTADDLLAVLAAMGMVVQVTRWHKQMGVLGEAGGDPVAFLRRRLCVGPERDGELGALLAAHPPPVEREVVTIAWDGAAAAAKAARLAS